MTAPAFPADAFGNALPLLPVQYGNSIPEAALTTASTAAVTVSDGLGGVIRVWVLGCDGYYKTGASSLTAASNLDALVLSNTFFDVPLPSGHTSIRLVAKSGSGFYRVEKLG